MATTRTRARAAAGRRDGHQQCLGRARRVRGWPSFSADGRRRRGHRCCAAGERPAGGGPAEGGAPRQPYRHHRGVRGHRSAADRGRVSRSRQPVWASDPADDGAPRGRWCARVSDGPRWFRCRHLHVRGHRAPNRRCGRRNAVSEGFDGSTRGGRGEPGLPLRSPGHGADPGARGRAGLTARPAGRRGGAWGAGERRVPSSR
jgi:hypothetical protein